MRYILPLILLILAPNSQAQLQKEHLVGGRFFGEISQANHLELGKYCAIRSNISCDVLKSYKPILISNYDTIYDIDLQRNKNLFYGLCVAFSGYWTNNEVFYQRKYTISPGFIVKYYTPVDIFLQTSIGFEYGKSKLGLNDPNATAIFTPTSHLFGFVSEIFTGYSFQLPGKAIIEPSISYKIGRSKIYRPDSNEKLSVPQNSMNFYLGLFFIINK